jgi:hypothetical protein
MAQKGRKGTLHLPLGVTRGIIFMLILFWLQPVFAAPETDSSREISEAAMKLVQFTADPKTSLDSVAVAALIDFVLKPKTARESGLPAFHKATGAYYEFDTRINFSDFLQYSYSRQIPSVLKSPSSLRYSLWKDRQGAMQKLPHRWAPAPENGKPQIIRGLQHDAITPDLTTGIYYEYDLDRTLIHMNYKGKQVLLAIAKQIDRSDVGRKGFILGSDDDWNYYYSGEPGSARAGLGWVKSYIYDYFSVTVYVETGASPATVRTGVFQWIHAGWSGMNFVQTGHVIKGIKRYAKNSKTILESRKLPAPHQVASVYQSFSSLPQSVLLEKYKALLAARRALAVQSGKIKTDEPRNEHTGFGVFKEQIIEELMLEYLKIALGKTSLLGKQLFGGVE